VAALSGNDDSARALARIACDHLDRGRVRLVLVGGPPASGKSTVARAIGDATGWPVLRSDEIRKLRAGLDPRADASAELDTGIYEAARTEATYADMLRQAEAMLAHGESVVLDASWSHVRCRERAAQLADRVACDLLAFRCDLPLEIAAARAARRRGQGDVSDATAAIATTLAARFPRWEQAHVLDTRMSPADVAIEALAEIGGS
jgi:predicted kinase